MTDHESHPDEQIVLRTPEGLVANVTLQGGYVESLTSPDGQELLFPKQEIAGKDRGGIPVCAPVFGPGTTVNLPQHGFARNLAWTEVAREDPSTVRLLLANPGEQAPELTGNGYARMATHLEIQTASEKDRHSISMVMVIENLGHSGVIVTPGFHPYFPAGNIREKGLNLLYEDGVTKFDTAELEEAKTLPKSELGSFGFSNGTHNISIQTTNLPVPVVWTANPDQYICVEPTRAGAATASLTTNLDEEDVLQPTYAYLYTMKIDWEKI